MVLLVGAGLMLRGFLREQSELPGFDTERLLTGEILLGGTRYFDKTPQDMNLVTPQCEAFFDQVLERVRALPGVRQAGVISRLPTNVWTIPFAIVGRPAPEPGKAPRADLNEVDAQALATLGIRLLRGRGIEERDVASAPWVAVVNKTFADRHFPGQDPIGRADPPVDGRPRPRAPSRSPSRGRSSGSWPTSPTRASSTRRRPPSTSPCGSTSGSTRARTSGSTRARSWRSAPRSTP